MCNIRTPVMSNEATVSRFGVVSQLRVMAVIETGICLVKHSPGANILYGAPSRHYRGATSDLKD